MIWGLIMTDFHEILRNLRRPRLLINAARFGLADYRRDRDLRRLLGATALPSPERALHRLIDEEAHLERTRKEGAASYSLTRHLEILIAVMAEARLLPRAG